MSEVEKLYKNAGVEKQYYYFDSADGNTYTWELNENGNDKHNMCFIGKPKIKDREFTAEKQLELIKFLSNFWVHINKVNEQFNISTGGGYVSYYAEDLADAIALYINSKWNNLTEQERTEVAEILRG